VLCFFFLQNGEQQKNMTLELEVTEDSSASHLKYTRSGPSADEFSFSFMQAVLPDLCMGGNATYATKTSSLATSIGFVYDPAEFLLAAQYDNQVFKSN
jgi:hypothetical protein